MELSNVSIERDRHSPLLGMMAPLNPEQLIQQVARWRDLDRRYSVAVKADMKRGVSPQHTQSIVQIASRFCILVNKPQ